MEMSQEPAPNPLLPGNEIISNLPLPARALARPGVCYCRMYSERLSASGDFFFFLEVYMLLVEMLFYPFMRTSSFPRTVYHCQPLKPQA